MADTTIGLPNETKDRLDDFRHPQHESYADAIESMMDALVPYDVIEEHGCYHCGEVPFRAGVKPYGEMNAVVHNLNVDLESGFTEKDTQWYCSWECAAREWDEWQQYIPDHPDRVVIGGRDQVRVEITDNITFQERPDAMELTFDIPGFLDTAGDWLGEPVYIENRSSWIRQGVIEKMDHTPRRTYMDVERNLAETLPIHPDEQKRKDWEENHGDTED